jgi:DNA-directed RNA polymerase specialized sigma24 family protein
VVDDLYQEGLLAIWRKGETNSPLNYQCATAQQAMWVRRQKGKSVDGRLNGGFRRPYQYQVLSLDLDLPVYGATHQTQPVEDYVVAKLTVQEMLALLTPPERECLGLIYQGFQQWEIARRFNCAERRIQRMTRAIREKLWAYAHDGQDLTEEANTERLNYLETIQAATNGNVPWTPEEDRVILEHWHCPAHEVALILGRTHYAVRHRRSRLHNR